MRDIKFRRWHKELRNMVYSDLHISDFFRVIQSSPEIYELMQFTGLPDIDGINIYEGDILQKTNSVELVGSKPNKFYKGVSGKTKKVIYRDGSFKLTKSNRSEKFLLSSVTIRLYGFKVIGNIYENPELLK